MYRVITTVTFAALLACGSPGVGSEDASSDNPDAHDEPADAAGDVPGEGPPDGVECSSDEHCDDGDPCTSDTCDTDFGTCEHMTRDDDGDGYAVQGIDGLLCGGTDCDDESSDVYPGAAETECDWVDNDCDGVIDITDDDGDGIMDVDCGGDDCQDTNPLAFPGADEVCDGVDDDCDGTWTDGGADDDGDGYLDADCGGDDCDDADGDIHPGADEVCLDGIDQDCDGIVDGPLPLGGDERVTFAPGISASPSLSWTGSRYGLAWQDDRLGKQEIYFAHLTADGTRAGGDLRITDAPGASFAPRVAWTGSEFGIGWWDTRSLRDDIYFVRLDADGARISSDVRVSTGEGESWYPSLVWTGSTFGMGWYSDRAGNSEIFYMSLQGDGSMTGSDSRITTAANESWYPALAWTGSVYGSAWQDLRHGNYEIYFSLFDADGAAIGTELRITDAAGASQNPSIAWTGSEFGIAWFDRTDGNDEIYFSRVGADGSLSAAPARITNDTGLSQRPSLVWTGSQYAIAWFDSRPGDLEIYFTHLEADGTKLSADARITSLYGISAFPSLVWTGSEFGVAWMDERDLNEEIYFNRIGMCD